MVGRDSYKAEIGGSIPPCPTGEMKCQEIMDVVNVRYAATEVKYGGFKN